MARVFTLCLLIGICSAATARSPNAVALEIGRSYPDAANIVRLHVEWEGSKLWTWRKHRQIVSYWEASVGYWRQTKRWRDADSVWDVAVTPVLRLQSAHGRGFYLESGVGAHLISEQEVTPRRQLGGHFQFGSHLGVGFVFGSHDQYDIGLRIQHLSNARLKDPNDGVNFATLRVAGAW